MKNYSLIYILFFSTLLSFSQTYQFETVIDLETTDVISQGRTGTCWSFSASSFYESEIMRLTGKQIDLSEMYTVRHTYSDKAWNYVMRQGIAQFSEGGLGHDVTNSITKHGIVPSHVFSGLRKDIKTHNHSKLVDSLKKILNAYVKDSKAYTSDWKSDVESTLDYYLGHNVISFNYEGVQYTPQTFLEMTKIVPENYISITSFMHQPYYSNFILNIPDNFSNGHFYNVQLDEMIETINHALENGFSIELDCDVSEKSFSSKLGIAIIPEDDTNIEVALTNIKPEKKITQEFRQQEFENYNTTDDHLMHITGRLKDQKGTVYYKIKNSWGNNSSRVTNGGYIYMSEAYMRLKTISIMIHKDALPKALKTKLSL